MHTQLDSEKLHIIKTACYRKEKWCEIKFFCSHLKLRILFRTQYVYIIQSCTSDVKTWSKISTREYIYIVFYQIHLQPTCVKVSCCMNAEPFIPG